MTSTATNVTRNDAEKSLSSIDLCFRRRGEKETSPDHNALSEPLLPSNASWSSHREENDHHSHHSSPSNSPTSSSCGLSVSSSTVPVPSVSRNVPLILAYTFFAFAGRSLWSQSVLATFVYLLKHDYGAVGYVTAVMGGAQLLVSFPAGHWADAHRRDTLLKLSSLVAVPAIVLTLRAACWDPGYPALVAALAAWGCHWGLASTASMALFADSVPQGQRSHYFTLRSVVSLAGNALGPLAALLLFVLLGNEWTIPDCARVIALGQFLAVPALVLSLFVNDDHRMTTESTTESGADDASLLSSPLLLTTTNGNEEKACNDSPWHQQDCKIPRNVYERPRERLFDRAEDRLDNGDEEEALGDDDDDESRSPFDSTRRQCGCIPAARLVPVLIAASDLVAGLASGMSIRYFPIFLVDRLHLGPVLVQALSVITPPCMAALMQVAQWLSVAHGRCRVAILFKWVGVLFMVTMIGASLLSWPTWLVCTLYVLRSAFMNSTSALTRSALMDSVPSRERGKWAAIESVNTFSWSGSAALGGYVLSLLGGDPLPLFGVTAVLQFAATLCLVPLVDCDAEVPAMDEDDIDDDENDNVRRRDRPTLRTSATGSSSSTSSASSNSHASAGQCRRARRLV